MKATMDNPPPICTPMYFPKWNGVLYFLRFSISFAFWQWPRWSAWDWTHVTNV